jgi:hypothetical protein
MSYSSRSVAIQLALFNDHQIWCVSRPKVQPPSRFSLSYCLWLAKSPGQRYEVMARQQWKCWHCGVVLNPRWVHLHHPLGYDNLGYEEASDLVAVHADCHRKIHDDQRRRMELKAA